MRRSVYLWRIDETRGESDSAVFESLRDVIGHLDQFRVGGRAVIHAEDVVSDGSVTDGDGHVEGDTAFLGGLEVVADAPPRPLRVDSPREPGHV